MNKYTPTIKELEQVYEALEKSLLITEDPQLLSVSKELLWVGVKRAFEIGRDFESLNNWTEYSDEMVANSEPNNKESIIL